MEKGEAVSKNEKIATHFNNYFNNITERLNIKKWSISDKLSDDPLVNAIRKYEKHPSIIKIKSSVEITQLFDFNFVTSDDISKIINSMDSTKKTSGAFPIKIVKLANKKICKHLANCINECIKQNKFPNELKIADITPIFKKEDPLDKTNYRPISILPTVSKIFERILFNQLQCFSNKFLINLQKWQKFLDACDGIVGKLLMDLSKAYDCVNHDLIIAKLEAYGVGKNSLRLLQNYLSQRQQRVKVVSSFSESLEIVLGIPQGSILGPILVNVFINDLLVFIKETDICNFADDTTLYACGKELDTISFKLEIETDRAMQWIKDNEMVANPSKFQLMFLSKYKNIEKNMSFDGNTIKSSDTVELLGMTLDKNINFKRHIQNICRKANNKTKALLRIRKCLTLEQMQALAEAYISSNFRYCPLIWIFCGKMSDNLIVKTQYRTLRAIYDTQTQPYEELLHLSGKKKIHTQNLQILMVEVNKCLNNISLLFTWDYFKQKYTPYHLRNTQLLELSKCRTKTYVLNTTLFKGSLLWNKLPNHFKEANHFKNKIQEWTGRSCTCCIYS